MAEAEEAELEENKKRPTLERQDERDETVYNVQESADGCENVDVEDGQDGHFGESESSKEEPIVRQAPRKRRSIRNLFKSTPLFNKSHSD